MCEDDDYKPYDSERDDQRPQWNILMLTPGISMPHRLNGSSHPAGKVTITSSPSI